MSSMWMLAPATTAGVSNQKTGTLTRNLLIPQRKQQLGSKKAAAKVASVLNSLPMKM